MKAFITSAITLLALYAQAASAGSGPLMVLNDTQHLNNTSIESVTPTLSLSGTNDGIQLIALAEFNTIKQNHLVDTSNHQNQKFGFGLYHQHSPQMYSQIVVKQHPFSDSRTLTSAGLKIDF